MNHSPMRALMLGFPLCVPLERNILLSFCWLSNACVGGCGTAVQSPSGSSAGDQPYRRVGPEPGSTAGLVQARVPFHHTHVLGCWAVPPNTSASFPVPPFPRGAVTFGHATIMISSSQSSRSAVHNDVGVIITRGHARTHIRTAVLDAGCRVAESAREMAEVVFKRGRGVLTRGRTLAK